MFMSRSSARLREARRQTAIDEKFGGGNVLGLVGGQEQRRIGGIPGVAHVAQRALRVARADQVGDIAFLAIDAGQRGMYQRRVHQSGQDAVGADAVGRVPDGHGPRHRHHRPLAGRVEAVVDAGPAAYGHRGIVDDRPGVLADHHRQHVVAGEVGALDIDRHQPVPGRLVEFGRTANDGHADVVDQDVDAPVGVQCRRHHPLDIGGASHVGDDGKCLSPPSSLMIACVAAAASASMSAPTTLAPSRAKSTDIALPLPQPGPTEPLPVTMATLSCRRPPISVLPLLSPVAPQSVFSTLP
jgi:hypothetical protein